MKYENYGDKNFFEYGRLLHKNSDCEYSVLVCDKYSDCNDLYRFAVCYINLTDDWIDKKHVLKFSGMTEETFNPEFYVIDCINYYGVEEFCGYPENYTYNQLINELKDYDIESEVVFMNPEE